MRRRALIEYLGIGILLVLLYGLVFLIASPAHAHASSGGVTQRAGLYTFSIDNSNALTWTSGSTPIRIALCGDAGICGSTQWYSATSPSQGIILGAHQTGGSSGNFECTAPREGFTETLVFTNAGGDGLSGVGDYYESVVCTSLVWTATGSGGSATTTIQITAPTQGTSTPSTTLDIGADYNIGTDLAQFSLDGSLPLEIGIRLSLLNTATNQTISLGTDYAIATSTGSHTYATTTTQIAGDYTLIAELVGNYGTISPPSGCTPFPPFTTCETTTNVSVLATSLPPITFALDNGTFPLIGFQVGSTTSRNGLATTTCSITQIGGCFQNALAFLFYPSPNALDGYATIWENIKNKPPFGYVTITIASLGGFGASSTPAFSFPVLPLMDTIFTPLRTGIGALLWLLFGVMFYKRLRHLDI